jgi:hypothetical protein
MQSPKKFINRLSKETSPYLRQHAHNPVDWYPWGEEALSLSKEQNKPILLSIGYSACHWCHVMEHESFENEPIAHLMNEHFVNIKVDREERPDLDQIYMNFVQMTTGRGGWPMTVFLTPDCVPFFGGTYFPPVDRFNMPGFPRILMSVAESYRDKQDEIAHSAHEILGELRRMGLMEAEAGGIPAELLQQAYDTIARGYDATNGGFGGAPKFPAPMTLEFLLRHHYRTGDETALEMVTHTCRKMADGGMYDQLGGGFHRYSVDAVWLVPHFEKMLYDNAQLARLYARVFQVTKDEYFRAKTEDILDYVLREMTDASGGFYSAQDADSEGVEGKFFVWSPEEINALLGAEDARLFGYYYDVSETGNFEGESILNVRQGLDEAARHLGVTSERLSEAIRHGREILFHERERRIKPFRDEKVLTAWNGLMMSAFTEAGFILRQPDYIAAAQKNADFIRINMTTADGRLLRTWKDGEAKLNAYLEDYALYADSLLELFQVTGEVKHFHEAKRLADVMIAEFWDTEDGGFYFTGNSHEELIVRSKDFYDNATPSGNSVAAEVLLKLAKITGPTTPNAEEKYSAYATSVLRLMANQIRRYPQAFGRALWALDATLNPGKEIVIIGSDQEAIEPMLNVLREGYLPNKVVAIASGDTPDLPLFAGRSVEEGNATAYVCENFVCQQPVTNANDLREQLEV